MRIRTDPQAIPADLEREELIVFFVQREIGKLERIMFRAEFGLPDLLERPSQ